MAQLSSSKVYGDLYVTGDSTVEGSLNSPEFIGKLIGNADSATNCSRSVVAGNGLTGGGDLTANRTLTLGTPSAITLSSTNSVATSNHTHAFTPGGTTSQYIRGDGSLATYANTTYSAGTGLSLSGTTFGQAITTSSSGSFVTGITQTTNGFQVNLGTPPNTNTTYSAMSVAEGTAGTATSSRTVRADYLKQIIQHYDTDTTYTAGTNVQISGTNVISATDTKYTHPTATARASGLYKITVNTLGHVTGATAVVQADILNLGISAVGPQGPRGYTGDKGDKPSHGWSGTSLRFENPDGTWAGYVNLKGDTGSPGSNGSNGVNATITSASATKLAPGATPTVTLGGTASARTFAFGIPEGAKGATGSPGSNGVNATITSATATGLGAGATPTVTLGGTASARTFAFGIPKGDKGDTGSPGSNGSNGSNGFTWRPAVSAAGLLTWTNNGSTSTPTSINIKGAPGTPGAAGAPGLTTNITVNGSTYTHSSGKITLPNYVPVSGGTFTGSITATGFFQSSDIRLKNVIEPLKINMKDILNIPSFYFTYKDIDKKRVSIGTSAQEVQKVFPEIVSTNSKGMLSVEYDKFGLIALELIKTQQKEIDSLKYELNNLKLKIYGYRN